jgi:hypothetical protein
MKNYCKLFILFFVLLSLFHLSCINNNANKNKDNHKNISDSMNSLVMNSDQIFKNWLKDTLIYLYNWQKEKETNIVKKEIYISDDSLSIKTNSYYATLINGSEQQTGEISKIIDLLKEYEELPLKSFKLSFVYYVFYQPSSVEQLRYDFVKEIKDLEIIEGDIKSNFSYIRGRLSGKEVTKNGSSGKQEIIKTDFIWKGDTLVKNPR